MKIVQTKCMFRYIKTINRRRNIALDEFYDSMRYWDAMCRIKEGTFTYNDGMHLWYD